MEHTHPENKNPEIVMLLFRTKIVHKREPNFLNQYFYYGIIGDLVVRLATLWHQVLVWQRSLYSGKSDTSMFFFISCRRLDLVLPNVFF
jgi:hypothetical protein